MLPREVLQHVFSVSSCSGGEPELSLDDRVRAMAVCSAWRDCLDPRKWPIDTLELDRWEDDIQHLVPWIASTRPAVLERLCIEAASQALLGCLPAIYQFSTLRKLFLTCKEDFDVPFDVKALTPLTALKELGVSGWEKICWEGGPLLPSISFLHFGFTDHVTLDTALPSLQRLRFFNASTVRLGAQHLWVPRLSSLSLSHVDRELAVSWGQLGSLKELEARAMGAVVFGAAELSALTRVTALSLGWRECQGAWDSAFVLLQAAPRSLRSLTLEEWPADQLLPPALTELTQLTSLQCGSLAIIPQLLPLKQLQELHFSGHSAASLSVPELAMLSELPSLRRLRFLQHQIKAGVWASCLKVG
ncbi:hypothetical protein N2152v2_009684 [Parachlorella kessleri]